MNPDKYYERRKALTKLLKKTPFQFQFISINDDLELTPVEIFKLKCEEMSIDLNENTALFDAFNEAVQIARGN